MPTLESLLYANHFERDGAVYKIKPTLADGAARGATSLQLPQLALFPVELYTPGGAALGSGNLAQAIRNAVTAAQVETGGVVMIPPGTWEIGDEEILIPGAGRNKPVSIMGAGMDVTRLVLPTGYSGTLFYFKGGPPEGDFFYNGGMSDLTIACESEDVSNDGIGVRIEGCVNMQFRNLTVRNFTGGICYKATRGSPDWTNQYLQMWNCTAAGGRVNYDWRSVVNSQMYGLYSGAARERDMICDDVKASIYGGYFQSSPDISCELIGEGGCRLVFYDMYWEGINPDMIMFKCQVPSLTYNVLEVRGFHVGGEPDTFLDVDAFTNVVLDQIYNIAQCEKILKARNGPGVTILNSGDPITLPAKFDLDAASAAKLVCLGSSGPQYTGGRSYSAHGTNMLSFANGAEPGTPEAGDTIRDSTYDRPSYRSSAAWNRVAFVSDDNDLTALLTPYAEDIWDPSVAAKRSVITGGLDSLTGLVNGAVLSAPASGQRPAWNIADDRFGGRPTFSCAFSGDRYLTGTLAHSLGLTTQYGMLVVFRANVAGADANRRAAIVVEEAAHAFGSIVGYGDLNDATHPYTYIGATNPFLGPASLDLFGHVVLAVTNLTADKFYFDSQAVVTGNGFVGLATALNTTRLGGCFDSSVIRGCDVTIAYAAVLKAEIPSDVRTRINRIAQSKFGLR